MKLLPAGALAWLRRSRQNEELLAPRERKVTLVADGFIPTVELTRRVVERVCGARAVGFATGGEFFRTQGATPSDADTDYLLVRTASPECYRFVQRLRTCGHPYAYLIDDNFWLLLGDNPLHTFYQNSMVRRTLEYAVAGAHVVLCHTEHFRRFLAHYNPNTIVVPPAFDFSLLEGLDSPGAMTELRIGVVANSSRAKDIDLLVPVVQEVLRRKPAGVVFEFFGFTPDKLKDVPGVRSLPYMSSYEEYVREKYRRGWILGLGPLFPDRFADYKTNNKVREFGACGIAAVYSDVGIYRADVAKDVNGWLVPNEPSAWVDAILDALSDPARTAALGQTARRYAEQHFDIDHIHSQWAAALEDVFRLRAQCAPEIARMGRKVQAWEAARIDGPQVCDAGKMAKRRAPGEECEFYQRDVFLHVHPGTSISSDAVAPVLGEFAWSMLIATYGKTLSGTLRIVAKQDDRVVYDSLHDLSNVGDLSTFNVRFELVRVGRVTFTITNDGSDGVALYALSFTSETRFHPQEKSFSLGFVV